MSVPFWCIVSVGEQVGRCRLLRTAVETSGNDGHDGGRNSILEFGGGGTGRRTVVKRVLGIAVFWPGASTFYSLHNCVSLVFSL